MGQTLSEPVTEKESAHCQNDELSVSKWTMTIERRLMLDFKCESEKAWREEGGIEIKAKERKQRNEE